MEEVEETMDGGGSAQVDKWVLNGWLLTRGKVSILEMN